MDNAERWPFSLRQQHRMDDLSHSHGLRSCPSRRAWRCLRLCHLKNCRPTSHFCVCPKSRRPHRPVLLTFREHRQWDFKVTARIVHLPSTSTLSRLRTRRFRCLSVPLSLTSSRGVRFMRMHASTSQRDIHRTIRHVCSRLPNLVQHTRDRVEAPLSLCVSLSLRLSVSLSVPWCFSLGLSRYLSLCLSLSLYLSMSDEPSHESRKVGTSK